MSLFRVKEPYLAERKTIRLIEFHRKSNLYVKRPPYQRKTVWSRQKQLQLIDSFFRQYYVPQIVLRQARARYKKTTLEEMDDSRSFVDEKEENRFKNEIARRICLESTKAC